MWMEVHILKLKLKLGVKQVIYESNISWKHKNDKVARYSARDHKNLCILTENSAEDLGSTRECCWGWCWGYMVTLQSLNYIEGNNWTGRPIWNYATGTLERILNWIRLSNLTAGKCTPMQVIKQPEHGRTSTTENKNDPPFRQTMINSK